MCAGSGMARKRDPCQSAGKLRPPARIEAFSDGIFAIAITLLVLEVAVPAVTNGSLLPGLAHLWPSCHAYVISFFSIGTIWILHYGITRSLRGVGEIFLCINLLLLFLLRSCLTPPRLFCRSRDGVLALMPGVSF